jgi:Arc/MetJ family transcription regulator
VSRTNIDIDEEACAAVMRRYGCKTKRDAVNLALRQVAQEMTLDEALAMRGTGWDADLDEIRSGMGPPEW